MSRPLQIAIDGPSGAGKSTIAKALAERLDMTYLDTGGLFRSFAYGLKRDGIGQTEIPPVEKILELYDLQLEKEGKRAFFLNGEDVSQAIRANEMSQIASDYSKHPNLREAVLVLERSMAETMPVIMDGRDIGSVVLPNAPFKIFLTAEAAERAKRRCLELQTKGQDVVYESVLEEIKARDLQDSSRTIAPLTCVPDAYYLDSTSLNFEEVLEAILDYLSLEADRLHWGDVKQRVEGARRYGSKSQ